MSLRTRLLLAVGGVAIVALVAADLATYASLRSFLYMQVDQSLSQVHVPLNFPIGGSTDSDSRCLVGATPAGGGGPVPPLGVDPDDDGDDDFGLSSNFVELINPSGKAVSGSECPAIIDGKAYVPLLPTTYSGLSYGGSGNRQVYFTTASAETGGPDFRVRASVAQGAQPGSVLVVAAPLGGTEGTLHHLLAVELAVTAAAIVVALMGGFWLVRIGLKPLIEVERTAELIADGNLTERVPGDDKPTEVGRLARTLNVMLGRIESAFAARVSSERRLKASETRLRQFVADASHELRTPIAAVSAYAELFERGASQKPEDLSRVMGGIRNESARMERLVNDLLTLARIDEGAKVDSAPVELVGLCAEAVQVASTVGPQWPVTFKAQKPVEVLGDPLQLRQVVDNLLGNIRSHTPSGTSAAVVVTEQGDEAVISVTDDGPGMAPDEAAHIFERFYRSDPSRSRANGGAGLGLSIVAGIVEAHGGSVSAEAVPGSGMKFAVRLPIAGQSPPEVRTPEAGLGSRVGDPEAKDGDRRWGGSARA